MQCVPLYKGGLEQKTRYSPKHKAKNYLYITAQPTQNLQLFLNKKHNLAPAVGCGCAQFRFFHHKGNPKKTFQLRLFHQTNPKTCISQPYFNHKV